MLGSRAGILFLHPKIYWGPGWHPPPCIPKLCWDQGWHPPPSQNCAGDQAGILLPSSQNLLGTRTGILLPASASESDGRAFLSHHVGSHQLSPLVLQTKQHLLGGFCRIRALERFIFQLGQCLAWQQQEVSPASLLEKAVWRGKELGAI